jgi:hypothetical protein
MVINQENVNIPTKIGFVRVIQTICAIFSLWANGRIRTLNVVLWVKVSTTVLLEHACVLQTFCAAFSFRANGKIRTHYLSIMGQVFYHCATRT